MAISRRSRAPSRSHHGTTTMDWIALAAAVVGLALALVGAMRSNDSTTATRLPASLATTILR